MSAPVPAEKKQTEAPVVSDLELRRMDECASREIYSVFHSIMSIIAVYLSYRCNRGFDLGSFIIACCCPYLYIIYTIATRGSCGIVANEPLSLMKK